MHWGLNRARNIRVDEASERMGPRLDLASWYTPGASDGLGDRLLMFDNTTASSLELLRLNREFTAAPDFESALRDRVKQLEGFSHPAIAKVRTVEWLGGREELALVSNYTPGRRLSEVMREARGPAFALELIGQLTPVLAALQQQGEGIAHGALSAERIVVTPEGRLVIVEHVLGSALESLGLPPERLRSQLGTAIPPGFEEPRLDARLDVVQVAFVALSLLLGRRVDPAEFRENGTLLLDEFTWSQAKNQGMSPAQLRSWLARALQLTGDGFASARDAEEALDALDEDLGMALSEHGRNARKEGRMAEGQRLLDPSEDADSTSFEFKPARFALANLDTDAEKRGGVSSDEPVDPPDPDPDPDYEALFALEQPRSEPLPVAPDPVAAYVPISAPVMPSVPPPPVAASARPVRKPIPWVVAALAVITLGEAAAIAFLLYRQRTNASGTPPPATSASVVVDSPVPGAEVLVDGKHAGITPLTLAVGSETRSIRVLPADLRDGPAPLTQPVAGVATRLEVTSDPVGARVTVDGTRRGVTPFVMPVVAGQHNVVITDGNATVTRTVNVVNGSTATVMVALAPVGTAAGWLTISAPLELQVTEAGAVVGTSTASKIMLQAGHHDLELTNAAVGFRTTLSIDILAGKAVSNTVAIPNGSISINALPWATVLLDGRSIGTTPIANFEVPIGTHEIIWRHPQLGERKQTVVVTTRAPVRLQMDLSK